MDTQKKYLQEYEDYLRNLAETKSEDIIFHQGSGIDNHSDYISKQIEMRFKLSQEIIRLYMAVPHTRFATLYFKEIFHFLDCHPNHKAKILITNSELMNTDKLNILKKIADDYNRDINKGNIDIKCINPWRKRILHNLFGEGAYNLVLLDSNKTENEDVNFIIFDSNQFRYEYDPVNLRSLSSFNQKKQCKALIKYFDTFFISN